MPPLLSVLLVMLVTLWVAWLAGAFSGRRSGRWLTAVQEATVTKYFPFHATLGPEAQERFERVTGRFLQDKEWQGAGMELKEEMKVMISACAAQLLHGFDERITLAHFDRIIVFPSAFRGHRKDRYHQGEVGPRAGTIKISWAHFLHGYKASSDAHNVGLHEMAHALWFEDFIPNHEDGFLDPLLLQDWKILGDQETAAIRAGKPSLLRDYAATNQEEFFAVAMEYFFERSVDFKAELPELYAVLCGLLKQDPLADHGVEITH